MLLSHRHTGTKLTSEIYGKGHVRINSAGAFTVGMYVLVKVPSYKGYKAAVFVSQESFLLN